MDNVTLSLLGLSLLGAMMFKLITAELPPRGGEFDYLDEPSNSLS